MTYWRTLVLEYSEDPALLAKLNGMGMPGWIPPATSPSPSLSNQLSRSSSQSTVPEPFTLGLLGAGLAFLTVYAKVRTPHMRG
jgi:hypothetical protein